MWLHFLGGACHHRQQGVGEVADVKAETAQAAEPASVTQYVVYYASVRQELAHINLTSEGVCVWAQWQEWLFVRVCVRVCVSGRKCFPPMQ